MVVAAVDAETEGLSLHTIKQERIKGSLVPLGIPGQSELPSRGEPRAVCHFLSNAPIPNRGLD